MDMIVMNMTLWLFNQVLEGILQTLCRKQLPLTGSKHGVDVWPVY